MHRMGTIAAAAGLVAPVYYPNAVPASNAIVESAILGDPAIYPTAEVMARLFPQLVTDAQTDRTLTRLCTKVRGGQ